MKAKTKWKIAFGILALIVATPFIALKVNDLQQGQEYAKLLAEARRIGMPTTAAEIRAQIPHAESHENAAEFYRSKELKYESKFQIELDEILQAIQEKPTEKATAKAKAFIQKHKAKYEIIDEATKRPRCWFDRKWEEGMALLLPELSNAKAAGKMLALRSSYWASTGQSDLAIADARKMGVLTQHIREEPTMIAFLVSESIGSHRLSNLAILAFHNRSEPSYQNELQRTVKNLTMVNPQRLWLVEAFAQMDLFDRIDAPGFLTEMGVKEEDGPPPMLVAMSKLQNTATARTNILKQYVEVWKLLDDPEKNESKIDQHIQSAFRSMIAKPMAAKLSEVLGGDFALSSAIRNFEQRTASYRSIAKALSSEPIPKALDLSNDPIATKYGLKYKFDGKQITITSNLDDGFGETRKVQIPPVKKPAPATYEPVKPPPSDRPQLLP